MLATPLAESVVVAARAALLLAGSLAAGELATPLPRKKNAATAALLDVRALRGAAGASWGEWW